MTGGAGTTFAALESGTPQLIIPNTGDTGDQVHHGARIASIGCGTFLRPLPRFDSNVSRKVVLEVASAVKMALLERADSTQACELWKNRPSSSLGIDWHDGVEEAVPAAVDTLRRLVAAAVVAKVAWLARREEVRAQLREDFLRGCFS